MRTLDASEISSVAGGGLWEEIKKVWHDAVHWVKSTTDTVNRDIGDLVTQGQPGTNPACNALGNTLGSLSHVADAANGSTELAQTGNLCNNAVKSVQHSLGQQPASGRSVR